MNIFFKEKPEPLWYPKLTSLFDACSLASDFSASLLLDTDGFWLAADNDQKLTGCLLLFQTGTHSWEGIPLVHPDFRRQGIFSSLLSNACKSGCCPGEDDLFFSVRPKQTLWKQVLEAIEAEKTGEEYMMESSLECLPSLSSAARHTSPDDLAISFQDSWGKASAPHVSCRLSCQGSSVYLYQLLTEEEFRRQGLAYDFLCSLFFRLKALGFSSVRLQVSGENLPAMALYKKTGFHITETLSFYRY